MSKNSVTVLMSTYNGDKYLDEQIESILNQSNVNVELFIRDDGSNDRTVNILQKWSKKEEVEFYVGENIGPKNSFIELMRKVPIKSEYYAFSDQDDVWNLQKLEKATFKMDDINGTSIFLSNYEIVDSNLKTISVERGEEHAPKSLEESLMFNSVLGCSMVFNKELMMLLKSNIPKSTLMHDYWVMLVVMSMNTNVLTSSESLFKYRQHSNNVIGSKGLSVRAKRLIKSALSNKNERYYQAISVYECFYSNMNKKNKKDIKLVKDYKVNFISRFKLLFSSNFRSNSKIKNCLFKVAIILGVY
jgi:rhamnosyltransferase